MTYFSIQLLDIYDAVLYLKNNTSGLTWDDELGMNIGPEEESIWTNIVNKKPMCAPFKKAGWVIFDDVAQLRPEKPKGSHTFRPTSGVQGPVSAPEASSQSPDANSFTPPGSPPLRASPEWDLDRLNTSMAVTNAEAGELQGTNSLQETLGSEDSAATVPSTPAPSAQKRPASAVPPSSKHLKASSSQAEALIGLTGALDRFGDKFKEGTQQLAAAINASPQRNDQITRARNILDEKETWLTLRQKITLGNKFAADHRKASTYIHYSTLGSPSRKTWVAMELDLDDTYNFETFFT